MSQAAQPQTAGLSGPSLRPSVVGLTRTRWNLDVCTNRPAEAAGRCLALWTQCGGWRPPARWHLQVRRHADAAPEVPGTFRLLGALTPSSLLNLKARLSAAAMPDTVTAAVAHTGPTPLAKWCAHSWRSLSCFTGVCIEPEEGELL